MSITGAKVCTSCKICDPQATTPGTCNAGSTNDMVCSCGNGYYGDGIVCNPCKTCAAHATKSGIQCFLGSMADTVICTCDAGYSGNGTVCTRLLGTATLVMLVTLPMTLTEFEADENKYIFCVAAAANVATSSVEVLNVTAVSSRRIYGATQRFLMSASVQVETSISSTTENEIMINSGILNAYLIQNGMPLGSLTILSNVSASTSATAQETSSSNSISLIIGVTVGIAVGSALVLTIGFRIWRVSCLALSVEISI